MQVRTFAAIDIGSYEISMKIFELSSKRGMKEISHLRYRLELGRDAFSIGKIGYEMVDKLCDILLDFTKIMKEYHVDAHRACATSAIREIKNTTVVLDQIRIRTGLKVEVLSNSEQRFLGYKSIASRENEFNTIIQKGTAILDVGGGSIQISLFDKESLVTTQNIRLGSVRVRELLHSIEDSTTHYDRLVAELIDYELQNFKKFYLKDRVIHNVIVVGDYITNITKYASRNEQSPTITKEQFMECYEEIIKNPFEYMAERLGISAESATLLVPLAIIYKHLIEIMNAETIWTPGKDLCDGLAYEDAQKNKILKVEHNFEEDILASARNIARRYLANKTHIATLESLSMSLYDSMKKVHGLGKRERLLLQIAVILHDCGKYISMSNMSECAYNIIMSTEIIGLSHAEREVVANIVKCNTADFIYYDEVASSTSICEADYLKIAKLTAILRLANAMDRSHKQKIKTIKVQLKDKELLVTVESDQDITLEKYTFSKKADFFEEVFGVKPVIRQKKSI